MSAPACFQDSTDHVSTPAEPLGVRSSSQPLPCVSNMGSTSGCPVLLGGGQGVWIGVEKGSPALGAWLSMAEGPEGLVRQAR